MISYFYNLFGTAAKKEMDKTEEAELENDEQNVEVYRLQVTFSFFVPLVGINPL